MQSAEGGDEAESTMMRSVRIVGPSQLEIASVSVPSPPDGHCLVRVDAAALNPTDVKHLASGMSYYGAAKASATAPVPFGSEGSGVVVIAAGGFSVGDEVCFLMDKMRTERSKPCEGSLSDYVCVHPLHMAKIWKGASLDDAAGTPLALLTAYLLRTMCMYLVRDIFQSCKKKTMQQMNHHTACRYQLLRDGGFAEEGCGSGKSILVHGGAGGVGHFALQLCRNVYGFDRVATTCSAANEGFARQCGATEVIPYSSVDFVQRCPRLRGMK